MQENASAIADDLDRLDQEYEHGQLNDLDQALRKVLCARRQDIREFQDRQTSLLGQVVDDDLAIRLYLLEKQAVDLRLEVQAQLSEIDKEKWYRREHGSGQSDREIVMEWIKEHAAGWRDYRTTAYIYVFDRNRDAYLACFRGEDHSP